MTEFQIDGVSFSDDESRSDFFFACADKYKCRMQENQALIMALLRASNMDERSSQRGEFVSEHHWMAYVRQHECKLLAATYYALAELGIDIRDNIAFHAAVSIAASNAFWHLLNAHVDEEDSVTITEFLIAIKSSPKQWKVQAVKRSFSRLRESMRLLCMEIGTAWEYDHEMIELCPLDEHCETLSFLKRRSHEETRSLDEIIIEYLGPKDTSPPDASVETTVEEKRNPDLCETPVAMENAQEKGEIDYPQAAEIASPREMIKCEPPDGRNERGWRARVERGEMCASESPGKSAMSPRAYESEYVKDALIAKMQMTEEGLYLVRKSEPPDGGRTELERSRVPYIREESEGGNLYEGYVEGTKNEEEFDAGKYDKALAAARAVEESKKKAWLRQEAKKKAKVMEDRLLAEAIARAGIERKGMAKREETVSEGDPTPFKKKVALTKTKKEAEKSQKAPKEAQETLREAENIGYQAEKETEDGDSEWDLTASKKVVRKLGLDYFDGDD
jgi:hypothetical protein